MKKIFVFGLFGILFLISCGTKEKKNSGTNLCHDNPMSEISSREKISGSNNTEIIASSTNASNNIESSTNQSSSDDDWLPWV